MTRGIPSAIVEGLYLSNPPEAQLLALPEIQQAEGKAIATAIDRFLTTEEPGSGFKAEFYDPHTTGTGTARGCKDITYTEPVEITTGFTADEHADLVATARSMGRPVDWLIRFGVYTLKFLGELPGAATVVPLAEADRPEAYGLTRTEVQKLASSLMVFLTNLPPAPETS